MVAPSTVYRRINNLNLTIRELVKICNFLNCSKEEMMTQARPPP